MPPVPFGEKTSWCAFQTTDVERVCEVLFRDRKPRRVSWAEGVDAAYHWPDVGYSKVLVTPPIDGFVLAMTEGWLGWWRGGELIARASGLDAVGAGEIGTRASEWSGDLDCCDVQFFASHRVYGLYGWGRHHFTEEDVESRLFTKYTGELVESDGVITSEERALVATLRDSPAWFGFLSAEEVDSRLAEERTELVELVESGQFELVDGRDDLATIAALSTALHKLVAITQLS